MVAMKGAWGMSDYTDVDKQEQADMLRDMRRDVMGALMMLRDEMSNLADIDMGDRGYLQRMGYLWNEMFAELSSVMPKPLPSV